MMFESARSFNQDISSWDVSKVTRMGYMLNGARSFNQNLGAWNLAKVYGLDYMFENGNMSSLEKLIRIAD